MTPKKALDLLIKGNSEYLESRVLNQRKEKIAIQKPFAIILGCADSRVPPELIFNQIGLGSLFVIRNAGNVVGETVLGSMEFAIENFDISLIIVLGHERCGAVTAAVNQKIDKIKISSHIKNIIKNIKPILNKIKIPKKINDDIKNKLISAAVKENVKHVVYKLENNSPIISQTIQDHKIKILGAYYDLDDGTINFI